MYNRLLKNTLIQRFFSGRALIIAGARRTGKTTLAHELLQDLRFEQKIKILNCDNPTERELLEEKDLAFLQKVIGDAKGLLIDEAQKVRNIGQTLKLLVDAYGKNIQLIVTGSSSLHLLDNTAEPLTGRKFVYQLFPLSVEELYPTQDQLALLKDMESLLIFGSYPEVVQETSFDAKRDILNELHQSYLYKDIFEFQQVKHPSILTNLLRALALQLGSEVSLTELARLIGVSKQTVEAYIQLLEKNFVIFRLPPYATNKRREISKHKKVYFYDLGIRNAIINNFNFLASRNDVGALWENFLMSERLKFRSYHRLPYNAYFWRTYDGSEIDLVEEAEGAVQGYEFTWSDTARKKPPEKWREYPRSSYAIITRKKLNGFII